MAHAKFPGLGDTVDDAFDRRELVVLLQNNTTHRGGCNYRFQQFPDIASILTIVFVGGIIGHMNLHYAIERKLSD